MRGPAGNAGPVGICALSALTLPHHEEISPDNFPVSRETHPDLLGAENPPRKGRRNPESGAEHVRDGMSLRAGMPAGTGPRSQILWDREFRGRPVAERGSVRIAENTMGSRLFLILPAALPTLLRWIALDIFGLFQSGGRPASWVVRHRRNDGPSRDAVSLIICWVRFTICREAACCL